MLLSVVQTHLVEKIEDIPDELIVALGSMAQKSIVFLVRFGVKRQ